MVSPTAPRRSLFRHPNYARLWSAATVSLFGTQVSQIAIPFIAGSEVGNLFAEDGREKPVTGLTGLWILLPILGAIIWFVKLQGNLNNFWHSKGAGGAAVVTAEPAAQ